MQVGYARTSTADQVAGFEAQIAQLEREGCERVFREQVSSVGHRAKLEDALAFLREGDILVVTKLDRLARSTQHLLQIVDDLTTRSVGLRIFDFGGAEVDTQSPSGKLTLTMFAAMAQFEREMMLERQREGIAKAKATGKYKGHKPVPRDKVDLAVAMNKEGFSPANIARELNLGRSTVYRLLKAWVAGKQAV